MIKPRGPFRSFNIVFKGYNLLSRQAQWLSMGLDVRRKKRLLMFWGEPYCDSCGYVGPEFMWMWHHGIGLGVLVQNLNSHELRVIDIDDNPVFYRQDGQTAEERTACSTEYVDLMVEKEIENGEERIDASRISIWEFESHGKTDLPCPRCDQTLLWRGTGIS